MFSLINPLGLHGDQDTLDVLAGRQVFTDDEELAAGSVGVGLNHWAGIHCRNQYGMLIHRIIIVNLEAAATPCRVTIRTGLSSIAEALGNYALATTGTCKLRNFPPDQNGARRGTSRTFNARYNTTLAGLVTVGGRQLPGTEAGEVDHRCAYFLTRDTCLLLRNTTTNSAMRVTFEGVEFSSERQATLYRAMMV